MANNSDNNSKCSENSTNGCQDNWLKLGNVNLDYVNEMISTQRLCQWAEWLISANDLENGVYYGFLVYSKDGFVSNDYASYDRSADYTDKECNNLFTIDDPYLIRE